jgi:hypothetical protein
MAIVDDFLGRESLWCVRWSVGSRWPNAERCAHDRHADEPTPRQF